MVRGKKGGGSLVRFIYEAHCKGIANAVSENCKGRVNSGDEDRVIVTVVKEAPLCVDGELS